MTLKSRKLITLFTPVILVLIVDQITKHWIRYSLELHRFELIEGWLAFNYTRNPGMAMGMDWLSTPAVSTIAILATIVILFYILKTLEKANYAYLICMGMILGGAFGNITDRLVMGYIEGDGGLLYGHVIDFIHFTYAFNDTPVFPYIFNIADMAISTSIIVMLLFHRKVMPVEEVEDVNEGAEDVKVKAGISGETGVPDSTGSRMAGQTFDTGRSEDLSSPEDSTQSGDAKRRKNSQKAEETKQSDSVRQTKSAKQYEESGGTRPN